MARGALDSLNRAKERKITTTIDSLVLNGTGFTGLDNPAALDSALKQYRMIKKQGYFDGRLNKTAKGIKNDFDVRDIDGDSVIYDAATKLTWQGGNQFSARTWEDAKAYVDTLIYAGFEDWRLPSLEEAMSLMEPSANEKGLYIDVRFNDTPWIWTADQYDASYAWVVYFVFGDCGNDHVDYGDYVRAVR